MRVGGALFFFDLEINIYSRWRGIPITPFPLNKMSKQIRTCVDCGKEYPYDHKSKHGATSRVCAPCAKRNARELTKRMMLDAAGGKCVCCGYSRCVSAMTFYDPIQRLFPEQSPKTREEKIEWASSKVPICIRCDAELNAGMRFIKVVDATARPPVVGSYTDQAQIIVPVEMTHKVHNPKEFAEVEVLPPIRDEQKSREVLSREKNRSW